MLSLYYEFSISIFPHLPLCKHVFLFYWKNRIPLFIQFMLWFFLFLFMVKILYRIVYMCSPWHYSFAFIPLHLLLGGKKKNLIKITGDILNEDSLFQLISWFYLYGDCRFYLNGIFKGPQITECLVQFKYKLGHLYY